MAQLRSWLLVTSALLMHASAGFAAGDRPPPPHQHTRGVVVTSRHGVPVLMVAPPHRETAEAHDTIPEAYDSQATFDNLDRYYSNAQFLSWYGFSESAGYSSSCGGVPGCGYSGSSTWYVANAIPITGKGRPVTTIKVPIYSDKPANTFDVGLYSSVGGLPGEEIAGGVTTGATTADCCTALQTVKIPQTMLAKGTQYFVVVAPVTMNNGFNYANEGLWLLEDTDYAASQHDLVYIKKTYRYCNTTNGTCHTSHIGSGWQPSTQYPAEPAAIIK
jgi:hypothetical protein